MRSIAIYKRCAHRGRDRDRCPHPWYGSYKLPGEARARVSLAKWGGADVRTKGQAQAAFDDLKAAIRDGTFNPHGRSVSIRRDAMTFPQLVDDYQKKYVAAKGLRTASEFKYRVKPLLAHFGSRPITKIRTSDIEDLQAELRRPRLIQGAMRQPSKASVNRARERSSTHPELGGLARVPCSDSFPARRRGRRQAG